MKVYGDMKSGNCYKVALLCSLLNIEHDWVEVDIMAGDTSTNEFIAKNPNGKIPLLELDDGRCISESNAILNYLANNSLLLPDEPYALAKVQQWQFFEQYSHEPYIAVARFIAKYLGMPAERKQEFDDKQLGGHKALKVMNEQLALTKFIASDELSVADIALYGYTHVADEGGFDLAPYKHILRWIAAIEGQDNYISMTA